MKTPHNNKTGAIYRTASAVGCIAIGLITSTSAAIVDLTTSIAATGTINGAIYRVDNTAPAGTGIFGKDAGGVFLQIQQSGMEQGYNTDGRPAVMDTKNPPPHNHSILYSSVNQVTIGGVLYHPFILDVNEPSGIESTITLDAFQLFSSTDPALTHGTLAGLAGDVATTLLYDMDSGSDSSVLLDYDLIGGGSGVADMAVFVPVTNFLGVLGTDNIILYSKFTDAHSAGFEEWTLGAGAPPGDDPQGSGIPEPSTSMLGVLGLALILRRRQK